MPAKGRKRERQEGSEAWPLAEAEKAFAEHLTASLGALDASLRLPFIWRAAAFLSTLEGDAELHVAIAPRDPAVEETLEAIRQRLRESLGPGACAPGETFHYPADIPDFEGFTHENVAHVDGFLYDDDELDDAVEEGQLSRHYCGDQGPRDVRPLNFISHSFSLQQLRFIFSPAVLGDLHGKTVVDVGSRTGAVLYAGAVYSRAKKLVGVESNPFFADLQLTMLRSHTLDDRAEVRACLLSPLPPLPPLHGTCAQRVTGNRRPCTPTSLTARISSPGPRWSL